ncbi:DUF4147 domain-containing protein, partial [Faecalibacterium duncaniae]
VFSIVLSDILGDPLDMIASGPAVPDTSTRAQALAVAEKYHLAPGGPPHSKPHLGSHLSHGRTWSRPHHRPPGPAFQPPRVPSA